MMFLDSSNNIAGILHNQCQNFYKNLGNQVDFLKIALMREGRLVAVVMLRQRQLVTKETAP